MVENPEFPIAAKYAAAAKTMWLTAFYSPYLKLIILIDLFQWEYFGLFLLFQACFGQINII